MRVLHCCVSVASKSLCCVTCMSDFCFGIYLSLLSDYLLCLFFLYQLGQRRGGRQVEVQKEEPSAVRTEASISTHHYQYLYHPIICFTEHQASIKMIASLLQVSLSPGSQKK